MRARQLLGITVILALAVASLPLSSAMSQEKSLKDQLVGKWTLVSFENTALDGTKRLLYGPNPKGIFILDANGRYAQVQVIPNRPKFKSSSRLEGTPEENKAALAGAYATFGTWSVIEADRTLIRNIEASATFPNEEGTSTKWAITMTGDELKLDVSAAAASGRSVILLKRIE